MTCSGWRSDISLSQNRSRPSRRWRQPLPACARLRRAHDGVLVARARLARIAARARAAATGQLARRQALCYEVEMPAADGSRITIRAASPKFAGALGISL